MKIIGFDAGYRNFAWVVYEDGVMTSYNLLDMWPQGGRFTLDNMIHVTRMWVLSHRALLNSADYLVLERQMKKKFCVQNAIIRTLYDDKCILVHPLVLSNYFGLPKQRQAKKAATIEFVRSAGYDGAGACTHRADAAAMILYALCQVDPNTTKETFQ